jgi:hypothetical protein
VCSFVCLIDGVRLTANEINDVSNGTRARVVEVLITIGALILES